MRITKIFNEAKPPEEQRKRFWKNLFSIITIEFASLSILEVLLILVIVGGGIYYIKNIVQKSYEQNLSEKIVGLEKCQKEIQGLSEKYAYDKVRIADVTNILLSLQDYSFDKGNLPESLQKLKDGQYLDGNIADPEFGKPYYYKKLSPSDYVLCVYLSNGVWGTNISLCPSKDDFLGVKKEVVAEQQKEQTPVVLEVKKVIITETPTDSLKVRKDASLDAKVLITVYPNEEYEILEEKEEWIKIKLKETIELDGIKFDSGWVWKEYTKKKV